MPKQTEIAILTVGGTNYQDWESVSVKHQLREMPAFSCRFTCSEGSPLSKHLSKLQIMPGMTCTVTLAGQLAFTGKVTTRQVFVDARRHHIEIQCANNLQMAISSVISKTGEWKDKEPEQIIRDVLKPLKINLKIEGGALPKFKIPRYSATPGESVHDFIDTLTRHLGIKGSPIGIAHTADVQGNFVILTGSVGGSDSLVEGKNMLEGREVIYDPLQAGGVPSPNQGPGNDEQHGAKVSHEPFSAQPFETFGQKYVPSVVVPEIPYFHKDLLEGRATGESNWLQESYVTVYGTVHGWLRPSGGLWNRGQYVTVNSPMLVMNGIPLILKSATFSQDNSTGTRTVLELVNTKALGEGVPTPSQ
jgi:prophage tail gpP-like protein